MNDKLINALPHTALALLYLAGVLLFGLLLTGCSHNTGAFTIGTRVNAGLDPQNATANLSYTDGLNVVDVSRENSSWDLEIDADNGVSVDTQNGSIKGVKRIRRDVGPQITGYLVDLAEKDPEMAKLYVESLKYYWKYRANQRTDESAVAKNATAAPASGNADVPADVKAEESTASAESDQSETTSAGNANSTNGNSEVPEVKLE